MQLAKTQFSAIIGLVIVISLISGVGLESIITHSSTITTFQTVYSSSTVTVSQTATRIINESAGNRLELIFNQTAGFCNVPAFITPWSVTLSDGESITEPPNSNFSDCCGVTPVNTPIVFDLPPGDYSYSLQPNLLTTPNGTVTPPDGTVSITNRDVLVQLNHIQSCGTTSTTESSP